MIVFIVIAMAFVLPLALYAPQPKSLRKTGRPNLRNRLRSCAGTLTLGFILLFTAAALFDENFVIDPDFMALWGLSRQGILEHGLVFQVLTANLLHMDLLHLVGNLSILMLLSAYERRVGWRRFGAVFLVAAALSSAGDLLWIQPQTVALGASGGLCGLAAAYFLDYPDLTRSEWTKGLLFTLFIVGVYSFFSPAIKGVLDLKVDTAAHIAGAFTGAVYVHLVRPGAATAEPTPADTPT